MNIDFAELPSPCFLIDESLLKQNLEILKYVQEKTGSKILLALKAFSMFSLFPLIRKYLSGVCASSLFEARLGYEEMRKEVHIFSPAYREEEFDEIMKYSDYIIFNSFSQWDRFKNKISNSKKMIECGLRINPEYSEIKVPLYNPCYKYSRLGITLENFKIEEKYIEGITGLHFHTHCEQNSDSLERTVKVVEKKFGRWIKKMKWINFGGGHHITRKDYDIKKLISIINDFREKYHGVQIYLEPGEAVALNVGFLITTVLEIIKNKISIAILDTSASTHIPDVLEMPYRPNLIGAGEPNKYKYNYRLGGMSCLAGDIIGDYSFKKPLKLCDKLVFTDMAHYTMVKTNTFNGINLPAIAIYKMNKRIEIIKEFDYSDFKSRL